MRGFRPFSGSPGLRAGSGAADFLHVRHPIPQSRFASVGECKPRSRPGRVVGESGWGGGVPVCRACRGRRLARGRAGCWRIRVGWRCSGLPGQPGQPGPEARPRPCGLLANQGGAAVSRSVGPAGVGGSPAAVRVVGESGRGVSRSAENPGRVSVCPAAGEGSRMPIRVSAGPKAEVRTNAGSAFGRMPGLPGYAWVSQPNRAVGLPERGACCGYGRSAVLARKNEGSPERLPSPSKINP